MVSDPGCRQPRKAYFVMHSPDYTKPAKSHFDDLAAWKYIFSLNHFSSRFPNVAQVSRESHLRSAFPRNRIFGSSAIKCCTCKTAILQFCASSSHW